MFDKDLMQRAYNNYKNDIKNENQRNKSWELCHKAFVSYKSKKLFDKDKEYLALHLYGYLASWGMMRGSSKLLSDANYLVFLELIDDLMDKEYIELFDLTDIKELKDKRTKIEEIYGKIQKHKDCFSPTLITKIMLGVYGCTVAYDSFVRNSLRKFSVKGYSCKPNFENLFDFVEKSLKEKKEFAGFVKANENNLPLMKMVDSALWYYSKPEGKEK